MPRTRVDPTPDSCKWISTLCHRETDEGQAQQDEQRVEAHGAVCSHGSEKESASTQLKFMSHNQPYRSASTFYMPSCYILTVLPSESASLCIQLL